MALVGITFVVLIVVLLFYINYRRKNRLYKQIVRESVDWLAKERQFSKRIAEQEKQLQELIGKAGAVDGGRYSGSSLNKDSQQELFGRLERLMQNDQVYKIVYSPGKKWLNYWVLTVPIFRRPSMNKPD